MNKILKGNVAAQKAGLSNVLQNFDLPPSDPGRQTPVAPEFPPQHETILAEAVGKAESLLEKARIEAGEIKKEAYDEAYRQGMQAGNEAGCEKAYEEQMRIFQQEVQKLEEKVAQYAAEIQREKEMILEQYLDDLKNISLAIGEKIVQASLKSSSEVVKKMILAATEKLKKTAWAKIYVAKTNEEMEIQGDAQFLNRLSRISDNVKIIVMEDAEPGSCIIEFPQEIIDISVGTQMENIREILNNARL